MAHKHSVRDTGAHFLIDQFTRQIKNDSANKTTIVQYDHNSERLTFEIPLYVDGHAMTLCDLIEIHYINISTDGNSQNKGTYEVNDIKAEGENAVFTWLISQECTQLAGSLNFFIVFKCTENGVTVYRWGTEIFKNLPISAGMDNGEAVLTEYPDILAQWKAQLFSASDTAVLNVATAEASALAAIEAAGEAKKQAVLDSIPDEYEALSALADQNHRNKAGAIVLDAEGESIVVNDASEYPLQNLKVFGKSTQDGTPTPDAPVDIVSVENPEVDVLNKNLVNLSCYSSSTNYAALINAFDLRAIKKGRTYTLSAWIESEVDSFAYWNNAVKVFSYLEFEVKAGLKRYTYTFVATEDGVLYQNPVNVLNKYPTNDDKTITVTNAQIEEGAVATKYVPFDGQKISIPYILPGIPVSSGGNYTDANGQQWICDEVDLARGVYVQRVNVVNLSNASGVRNEFPSGSGIYRFDFGKGENPDFVGGISDNSHGYSNALSFSFYPLTDNRLDNAITCYRTGGIYARCDRFETIEEFNAWANTVNLQVMYILATPIETALSDAEITAFKALHSNRPNTTILNDAGAHMAVSYVADTKTYIDNAIAKITNA